MTKTKSVDQIVISTISWHTKTKKRNSTSGDFKLGNINKVRHVLDAKTTTNSDCNFLFNLRSYTNNNNKNNQDKDDEGKKEPERWVDCQY